MRSSLLSAAFAAAFLLLAGTASAQDGLAPQLYPNPVADEALTVAVADAAGAELEVVDLLGRRVSTDASLAAGVYLVRALYADGRATAPARLTKVTAGPLAVTLVEAGAALALADGAPEATAAKGAGGCPTLAYAGLCHRRFTGNLRLLPANELRISPTRTGLRVADYEVDLGEVRGVEIRYNGVTRERPFQVLTPDVVGDSYTSYVADYDDGGSAGQALFGPFEATFNDGVSTDASAVQLGFTLSTNPTLSGETVQPASMRGGGSYQYIIMADDETVVASGTATDTTPLFAVDPSGNEQIYLENSIIMTRFVDGYEVDGGPFKPGDVSVVFAMTNAAGDPVEFHVGEGGGTTAVGRIVHITPDVSVSDPFNFTFSNLRSYNQGAKRHRARAMRIAAGGSFFVPPPSAAGAGFAGGSQWGRNQIDFADQQVFNVLDANGVLNLMPSGDSPMPTTYGVQWGRESNVLSEVPSAFAAVFHEFLVAKNAGGGSGYLIDADGEYHDWQVRVRNESDMQDEIITANWFIDAAGKVKLRVDAAGGTFSSFEFVYIRDGVVKINNNYAVGDEIQFGVTELEMFAVGAADDFGSSFGTTGEEFGLGFILDTPLAGDEEVYIMPHFTTPAAEVAIRHFAALTDAPHFIGGVQAAPFSISAVKGERWTEVSADR